MLAIDRDNNLQAVDSAIEFVIETNVSIGKVASSGLRPIKILSDVILLVILFVFGIILFVVYIFLLIPISITLFTYAKYALIWQAERLRVNIKKMSYEETKLRYTKLVELTDKMRSKLEEINNRPNSLPFDNLMKRGINSFYFRVTVIETILRESLYIDAEALCNDDSGKKHLELMRGLQDIWGEDEGNEYSKLTHKILTSKNETF